MVRGERDEPARSPLAQPASTRFETCMGVRLLCKDGDTGLPDEGDSIAPLPRGHLCPGQNPRPVLLRFGSNVAFAAALTGMPPRCSAASRHRGIPTPWHPGAAPAESGGTGRRGMGWDGMEQDWVGRKWMVRTYLSRWRPPRPSRLREPLRRCAERGAVRAAGPAGCSSSSFSSSFSSPQPGGARPAPDSGPGATVAADEEWRRVATMARPTTSPLTGFAGTLPRADVAFTPFSRRSPRTPKIAFPPSHL